MRNSPDRAKALPESINGSAISFNDAGGDLAARDEDDDVWGNAKKKNKLVRGEHGVVGGVDLENDFGNEHEKSVPNLPPGQKAPFTAGNRTRVTRRKDTMLLHMYRQIRCLEDLERSHRLYRDSMGALREDLWGMRYGTDYRPGICARHKTATL